MTTVRAFLLVKFEKSNTFELMTTVDDDGCSARLLGLSIIILN